VCLLSPNHPIFPRTLKLFIGKIIFWRFRLLVEPNSTFLSFNPSVWDNVIISVEGVFKTVNEYKNNSNNITQTPNSLNYKIEFFFLKSGRPYIYFFQHVTVNTHTFSFIYLLFIYLFICLSIFMYLFIYFGIN
jgi:hypothetical protein